MKKSIDQERCEQLLKRMRRPLATVLGSGVPNIEPELYNMASDTGELLVKAGYSVLTGGGPGTMDAVNAAASAHADQDSKKIISGGIRVKGIDDTFECPACHESIVVHSFGIRKHCLLAYCDICVVLPGGVGTADEFWHLLNYIKHGESICKKVILLSSDFWAYQIRWLQKIIAQGLSDACVADKVISLDSAMALSDYLAG